DAGKVLIQLHSEVMSGCHVREEEDGRHTVLVHAYANADSARARQRDHAPLVRANERSFRCSEWNVEEAFRISAVKQERPRASYRLLHSANRIADVAAHLLPFDGV